MSFSEFTACINISLKVYHAAWEMVYSPILERVHIEWNMLRCFIDETFYLDVK
jgi:hypothetical protein